VSRRFLVQLRHIDDPDGREPGFVNSAGLTPREAVERARQTYSEPEFTVTGLSEIVPADEWQDVTDDDGCEGHESLAGEHMGETVYCDGSCR
jgi:hypothetical protein